MSNYSSSEFDEDNTNSSWYKASRLIPIKSKVLDVGCSSGNFGAYLIDKRDCKVDGIELFEEDFKLSSKKLRKVWNLNVESDSLKEVDDDYDVIYMGDVIEHLVDPARSLKKLKELLNNTGFLVFSVPNMANIMVRLHLLNGDFDYTETGILDKTHIHFYTLKELERVINEGGMEVREIDFVEKDLPNKLIDSVLSKHGLKASKEFYKLAHQPEAAAFQFVGVAQPNIGKPIKVRRGNFSPIDFFEDYHNGVVNSLNDQIKVLEHKLKDNQGKAYPTDKVIKKTKEIVKKIIQK
jgi:2-polyprenyl-3-methyl-5-hydroxy-6-metoxy-1,4-benzoquinol methylase